MPTEETIEAMWYRRLTEGEAYLRRYRRLMRLLPSNPRCKMCNAPFRGAGGYLMRMIGRDQSRYNPRFCEPCKQFDHPGGAEVVVTMFFADVRGSTALAEQMGAREFSRLIHRFYSVATDVLVNTDAFVDKFVGDEVVGLYVSGMAGPEHPRLAIEAAVSLLKRTGHRDAGGPWLPVGIGVHTGLAFVGVVGGEGGSPTDFTALGDNVNITARLASAAGAGQVMISEAAIAAAGLNLGELERRQLALKGKQEPTAVRVLSVTPD